MKLRSSIFIGFCVAIGAAQAASTTSSPSPPPPTPPMPAIRALKLEPASLRLRDGRDERRVLVLGMTDGEKTIDLTSQASFKVVSGELEIDSSGYLRGKAKGAAEVLVSAAGRETKLAVTVEDASQPAVRFVRDVEPILSKAGCNQGTCHGSAKGKNGFKLSLRGYDSEYDYQALVSDLLGRRFNRVNVDESLMLLKPLGDVPHEGRQALKPGSREHLLLRQWIAEGTRPEDPSVGRAKSIEILPADVEMDLPGRVQQLLIVARYADGSTRDVTREAVFSVSNGDVAEVKTGLVRGLRRGETAVLVRYEGLYGARLVTVMGDRSGYEWVKVPEHNFIDQHVNAKLRRMKILPSELCTDAEFIRRVSLDLTGLPPRTERVRAFLEDKTPVREKREKLVEDLLGSNDYIECWANKWADLLQCNSENLGQKSVWLYRDWIRRQIAENTRYDRLVRSLLTAQGSSYENPAVNYLRVLREPGKMTEDVSQTFLGVRFNCNKCHDHPFERWTQNQYYQMGAYFAQIGFKRGQVGREVIFAEAGGSFQITAEEVVFRKPEGGEVKHPKTDSPVSPHVPVGQAREVAGDDSDRRDVFVDWLTSKDNPFFAKAMANRIWSYFLGRGIIDPVDDIRASNPPSNPELLDALAKTFVESGWDLRQLMRTICQSRTYQLSIVRTKWNEDDTMNFSHALPRRLSAEQMVDALSVATGAKVQFTGVPKDMRAAQIPDGMVVGNEFLTLFGRPKRQSACECERSSSLTLSHALSLINGTTLGDAISSGESRFVKLAASEKDDRKLIEEIYFSCLSRPPTEKELKAVEFKPGANRLEVAQDLAWALFNSPSFLFNR